LLSVQDLFFENKALYTIIELNKKLAFTFASKCL